MKKKIKLIFLLAFLQWNVSIIKAQSTSAKNFTVGGDFDKFYPVVFSETNWYDGATEFEISRSNVHLDSEWRGSLIARFRVHTTRWGHRSNFINAEIINNIGFIANWADATGSNGTADVVVWLRGGGTTYYFRSINSAMDLPIVYLNGFQEENGPRHTPRTTIDTNINNNGLTYSGNIYASGNGAFLGSLLIGKTTQTNTTYKLDVEGPIRADEIVVNTSGADFVFDSTYNLRSLPELETFIKQNKHLPEIATAKEMQENGVSAGEMQTKLLQKVEELTLYVIELKKENEILKSEKDDQIKELKNKIQKIESKIKYEK
jgi:hypothetical protein